MHICNPAIFLRPETELHVEMLWSNNEDDRPETGVEWCWLWGTTSTAVSPKYMTKEEKIKTLIKHNRFCHVSNMFKNVNNHTLWVNIAGKIWPYKSKFFNLPQMYHEHIVYICFYTLPGWKTIFCWEWFRAKNGQTVSRQLSVLAHNLILNLQ